MSVVSAIKTTCQLSLTHRLKLKSFATLNLVIEHLVIENLATEKILNLCNQAQRKVTKTLTQTITQITMRESYGI